MNQINVNPSRDPVETVDTSGDRTAAAGINMITVLIVLVVLAVIVWYLFTGPLRGPLTGGQTNINVNPAPTVSVNAPQPNGPQPTNPNQPAGNGATNGGGTTGGAGATGGAGGTTGGAGGTGNNPPANP